MKIHSVHAGNFACDGGALFGAIPKALWQRKYPCNEQNMIKLTMRCMLIEQGERKILIEAGVGDHYGQKLRQNNGHEDVHALTASLAELGIAPDEITDVLFTHLHWDHCNGAVVRQNGELALLFPKATHWCSKKQWEHSFVSNRRERAAYYRDILDVLKTEGNMQLIEHGGEWLPNIELRLFDGHTPGQIIPLVQYQGKTLVYTADFIPTTAHIPIVWLAAYDLYPVSSMSEKESFLQEAAQKNYVLFFEHDYYTQCATVAWTDEKASYLKEKFLFEDLC